MMYRICSMRGEPRDLKDPGGISLTSAIKEAETLVNGGSAYPGLTIYEWSTGARCAVIKPGSTEIFEH